MTIADESIVAGLERVPGTDQRTAHFSRLPKTCALTAFMHH
jgi:hypothetical protein